MLHQVLDEIQSSTGPISIGELCRKLNVERSLVESMVDFWVRKGRIQLEDLTTGPQECTGRTSTLCKFCPTARPCPGHEID